MLIVFPRPLVTGAVYPSFRHRSKPLSATTPTTGPVIKHLVLPIRQFPDLLNIVHRTPQLLNDHYHNRITALRIRIKLTTQMLPAQITPRQNPSILILRISISPLFLLHSVRRRIETDPQHQLHALALDLDREADMKLLQLEVKPAPRTHFPKSPSTNEMDAKVHLLRQPSITDISDDTAMTQATSLVQGTW